MGDAQCIVVQVRGKVLVMDCGDREGGRRAGRLLWDFFQERGLPRIDLLVLSHGDSDHSGGLDALLESIPTRLVLLPAHPKCAGLVQLLRQRGQAHHLLLPGERWEWQGLLQAELPLESADLQSSNDGGLLSWLHLGEGLRFLCFGDQEGEALDRIRGDWAGQGMSRPSKTEGEKLVILLPHHGAPSQGLFRLVTQLQPTLVLESSSKARALRQQPFHRSLGQRVWSTGLSGRLRLSKRGDLWILSEEHAPSLVLGG